MPLHPDIAAIKRNLPRVARSLGFSARVTSAYRSRAAQTKLYNRWLNGLQPYPVAPPGTSDHERGLALDVVSTDQTKLVSLLREAGLQWAGPADPVHFSMVGPQIASQGQKIGIPKTVKQVANVFFEPIPLKLYDFFSDPVGTIKDNVQLAADVLTWFI